MTGSPLSAYKRLQFNLEVKPLETVDLMKNVPDVIFRTYFFKSENKMSLSALYFFLNLSNLGIMYEMLF